MEKIWSKKEFYIKSYEFLKLSFFSKFYLIFINIFFTKIVKKGLLPAGADVASGASWELTWRAGSPR